MIAKSQLEKRASPLFRGPVTDTSVDLSTLETREGTRFGGFDATGTWLLGLECGSCFIPAPRYLTIVDACAPQ